LSLTQTQLASAVADRATDAKRALAALEEIVLEQLANAEKVRIGGLVQLTRSPQAGAEEAPGPKPRDRRGDHDRGQVSERGPARPAAGESEDSAAVGAESTPAPRRVTRFSVRNLSASLDLPRFARHLMACE
jgi:hypothetical protein